MSRYQELLKLISIFKPESIIETGVWNGDNAVRMIQQAQQYSGFVTYRGYDLFEDANEQTDAEEFNVKPHISFKDVHAKVMETGAKFYLTKGNTRYTLKPIIADFAFIDGGHSIETIRHDFEALKGCAVIVLDDYYLPDENGIMPDTSKIGCNRVLEGIPHAVVKTNDYVKGGGFVNLAVVFGG
jgi:hypothetical protein